eukprot:TRINITY_DN93823_c0_g1_i1.p1 TRINITY_DN93823_c0_g1~~TRINITY_DN93823_c0_g1_i1.p1  ORF type:complete len:507 (-),score=148.95 TRINITY_DN93823_c0_g1_i1:148-1668(-)
MTTEEQTADALNEAVEEAYEGDDLLLDDDADGLLNEEDLPEQLKDAVEGSLHLKRLLTEDDDKEDGPAKKKWRHSDQHGEAEEEVARKLLKKWQEEDCQVMSHVLQQCNLAELEQLLSSGYMPNKYDMWKSVPDQVSRRIYDNRERGMLGGGANDGLKTFVFKHKLKLEQESELRKMCHKDLRYVLEKYDGTKDFDELVKEAKEAEAEDDNRTESAVPELHGVTTFGRMCRLELIDPCCDAAIFGDANLTFAKRLMKHRKGLGHVGRVIATTFEEMDTLKERYPEIMKTVRDLQENLCEVFHGVDCTKISTHPQFRGLEGTLGAVYYNFPHSGAIQGFFDGHPVVNWRHENLMRLFFRALRGYVRPGGIVKVASNMGAVGVRYSYIVGGAQENEFTHAETMPFMQWILHRYGRSYGDRRDAYKRPDAEKNESYNAQAADRDMVYCFKYEPSGKKIGKQFVRLPPQLKTLLACTDGPFQHLTGDRKTTLAKNLHNRFLKEISGVHVG